MKDVDRRDAEGLAANLHSCVSPALNHIILLLAALLQNSASSAAACNLRKSSTANPPRWADWRNDHSQGQLWDPHLAAYWASSSRSLRRETGGTFFFAPSLFKHFLSDSGTRTTFLRQLLRKVHKQ